MKPPLIIKSVDDFKEDVHFRLLEKFEQRGKSGKKMLAVVMSDVFVSAKIPVTSVYKCIANGIHWATIQPDGLLIKAGYAWNLNTCAPNFFRGKIIAALASLCHDVFFQFSGCFYFPSSLTLSWCNNFYFAWFSPKTLASIYRAGLAMASWLFWNKESDNDEWVEVYERRNS